MTSFAELKEELALYLNAHHIASIQEAYKTAREAHKGQRRHTGEPYVAHPVEVAYILSQMRLDQESIIAALLHDVLEDTDIDKQGLVEHYGTAIAELVDGVSKLTQMEFQTRAEAQAENFRKMILAMSQDIRVIMIKLADRLHNMRTLQALPVAKQRRIARETLEIYAPIAHRLGMHRLFIELEDLCFQALYPFRSRVIRDMLSHLSGSRREFLRTTSEKILEKLQSARLGEVQVVSREKHIYSIYKKMRSKHLSFSEITDVFALRIVVENVDACYRALGLVHNLFKPVPERFKDYIAIPKANGYQSLHTTLFGPYGFPIEIQIRTTEMHRLAENGIASHWLYKEKGSNTLIHQAQTRANQWLQGLLEMQRSTGSSLEFIENVKIELFPDEVYVFTPKGDIIELPSGATPIDFAYAIHSDIGNACVAAKLDRRLAPLSAPLANGQRVEIITAPGARPNPVWLKFVVTGKARSNIRHFLKNQQRTESINFGKRLWDRAFATYAQSLERVPTERLEKFLQSCHLENIDDLYEEIGLGNQMAMVVAERLLQDALASEKTALPPSSYKPLPIKGSEGVVVGFAECCHPIPGDPILGVLQPGHGILVHLEQCPHIDKIRAKSGRCLELSWEDHLEGEFSADIQIQVANQRGVLAKIATAIAAAEGNIENIRVDPQDGAFNTIDLIISVRDRVHLAKIMRKLRALKEISRIARQRGEVL